MNCGLCVMKVESIYSQYYKPLYLEVLLNLFKVNLTVLSALLTKFREMMAVKLITG